MNDSRHNPKRGVLVGWIISHPKTTMAFIVLLLMVLCLWAVDGIAQRRLDRLIAAIRAKGEPASVEDLNAAIPHIPDEENMAVPLMAHAEAISGFRLSEDMRRLLPILGTSREDIPTGQHLSAQQLESARLYLGGVAEALVGAHRSLEREGGCIEMTWTTPAINASFIGFSAFRQLEKALVLEAWLAAEEGDSERAAQIIHEVLHAESVLDCQSSTIAALVQIGVRALAESQIERTINLCTLNGASLEALQNRLAELEGTPDIKRAMLAERASFIDMAEWLRSGEPGDVADTLGAPATLPSVWRYVPILPVKDEADAVEILTTMIDAIMGPTAETIERIDAAQANTPTAAGYCLVSNMSTMMMPSLSRAVKLWVRGEGTNRAMQAAIACERYRLASGDWPAGLEALVPAYLDAVPVDPFDGKAIRYARIPEGIKVWTIGEDMTDNDGDVRRLEPPKGSAQSTDHGWVLLNPELRGREAVGEENSE